MRQKKSGPPAYALDLVGLFVLMVLAVLILYPLSRSQGIADAREVPRAQDTELAEAREIVSPRGGDAPDGAVPDSGTSEGIEPASEGAEGCAQPEFHTAGAPCFDLDPDDWRLALVNASNPIAPGFVPELETLAGGQQFDRRAIDSLEAMLEAGKQAGMRLVVCSGYRSEGLQDTLFQAQVAKQKNTGLYGEAAIEAAKRVVAYPGQSEHNLGLAADIVAQDYQVLDSGFAATAEGQWLLEHCAEFGFVLRYPDDKQDITGIIYEPWHFRYVGEEHAAYMMATGLCLEEYLAGA